VARSRSRFSIDISEEAGVRRLHFGSDWVQGAMRIARPWSLELAYTREMMASLLFRPREQWPKRALLIGLGAGSLAKFIYRYLPDCRMTVVEIEPQVEFAARQFFKLPDDPKRLKVVIGDGVDYLLKGGDSFDSILLDGFDANALSGALDSLPVYQACRARLNEQGFLAVNLLGREKNFVASVDRIREAFSGRAVVFPSCDSGNTIAFGCGDAPLHVTLDDMRERASALKQETRLDLLPTISRLQLGLSLPNGVLEIRA
jgi:spermidine synthase